jgi:predicted nuclease of predicted toxin-antitoxin system
MKLLLDANISWRLAGKLQLHFETCLHVDHIDLTIPAKDKEIWEYALKNSFIIITNDDDFVNLVNIIGFPPKVVLLRTGNQSNVYIGELLIRHKKDIEALHNSVEYGLLEIF